MEPGLRAPTVHRARRNAIRGARRRREPTVRRKTCLIDRSTLPGPPLSLPERRVSCNDAWLHRLRGDPEDHLIDVIAWHLRAIGELSRLELRPGHELVTHDLVELRLLEMAEAGALGNAAGRIDQQPDLYDRLLSTHHHLARVIVGTEPPGRVGRPNGPDDLVFNVRINAPVPQRISTALVERLDRLTKWASFE